MLSKFLVIAKAWLIFNDGTRLPCIDNWDLWVHIYEMIQDRAKHIHIIKTKGHDCDQGSSQKHWQAWANTEVDKQAKLAVQEDWPDLFSTFSDVVEELENRRVAHTQVLKLQIVAANLAFRTKYCATPHDKKNGVQPIDVEVHNFPHIPGDIVEKCPINQVFLQRLATWCRTVLWEIGQSGETSYLELCLDFMFTTKTCPPLPIPKYHNRSQSNKQWILLDQEQGPFCVDAFTLDQAIQGMSRTINWLYKHSGILLVPYPTKNQTTPLKRYGFRGHPAGVPCRAKLIHQDTIDTWCHRNLCGYDNFKFPIPDF